MASIDTPASTTSIAAAAAASYERDAVEFTDATVMNTSANVKSVDASDGTDINTTTITTTSGADGKKTKTKNLSIATTTTPTMKKTMMKTMILKIPFESMKEIITYWIASFRPFRALSEDSKS